MNTTTQELSSLIAELDPVRLIAFVAASSHTIPELNDYATNIISKASADELQKAEKVLEALAELHPDDESYRKGYQLVQFVRMYNLHPDLHETILTTLKAK